MMNQIQSSTVLLMLLVCIEVPQFGMKKMMERKKF